MSGWTRHEGPAAALPGENIDTDQLIPARFMARPRSEGYGRFLLHDAREGGGHVLDRERPEILIAGRNFGSGSSREAAVYALADYGIRAVVAPSFGDIFAGNAVNNGVCPAVVADGDVRALREACRHGTMQAEIDLAAMFVTVGGVRAAFTLDDVWREKLMKGWDDVDLTRAHADAIAAFRDRRKAAAPWVWRDAARHEGGTT